MGGEGEASSEMLSASKKIDDPSVDVFAEGKAELPSDKAQPEKTAKHNDTAVVNRAAFMVLQIIESFFEKGIDIPPDK